MRTAPNLRRKGNAFVVAAMGRDPGVGATRVSEGSRGGDGSAKEMREIHFPPEVDEHGHERAKFASNAISTAKYNAFTFVPKFLFVFFSKVCYFYFLVQATLSWWSVISPFGGIGFTLALVFMLGVSGLREAVEDYRRHQFDKATNNNTAHVVTADGDVEDVPWYQVRVGQFILVHDKEEIPADCVCVHAALGSCYVSTANLDGETNLKIKQPMKGMELSEAEVTQHEDELLNTPHSFPGRGTHPGASHHGLSSADRASTMRDQDTMSHIARCLPSIRGEICCDAPSADLHHFTGHAAIASNPWVDRTPRTPRASLTPKLPSRSSSTHANANGSGSFLRSCARMPRPHAPRSFASPHPLAP